MSSNLTSVSINKNKSRFAPKVKSRPSTAKRSQASDGPTSSASSSTSTVKSSLISTDTSDRTSISATAAQGTADPSIELNKPEETIRQKSNTLPTVTSASNDLSTSNRSSKAYDETTSTKVSKKSKPSSASRTPIVIAAPSPDSSSTTTSSTIKKSTVISEPTNAKNRSVTRIDASSTPSTPIPNTFSGSSKNDGKATSTGGKVPTLNLTKKQKQMKNIKDAMKKSDKTPSLIPTPKPTSGHSFAAPSNITPPSTTTTKTTTTTTTIIQPSSSTSAGVKRNTPRKRRVQMVRREHSDDDYEGGSDDNASTVSTTNEEDELSDDSENEVTNIMMSAAERRKKRRTASGAKPKKKKEVLLAKDMKTLDDLTTDPLIQEDLDRDIKYFLKDLPRGVVTKQFRDEQIEREQEQLKRDEETATLKNDQQALDRLAEQRLALEQQKEKEEEAELARKAKEEEAEEQRKKQQSSGLAESNHALQVRIVNGQIVLDADSMMIDRNKDREQISHEHMEVVEENAQSRKVNFKTYGKNTGNKRWTDEETDLFYDLLSQFGTDFEMMAQMIPHRSRTQVRLKYNKEQKMHPERVTEYMVRKKKPLDLETFQKTTGLEFEKVPDHFHTLQIV